MKALASDIDGTLVFNQQIKKQDRKAIEKYQKEHLFGVCSGRPRCALFDLEKLKLDFYILSSGAEILDKDLNIIQDFPMKKEIVQQIFNDFNSRSFRTSFSYNINRVSILKTFDFMIFLINFKTCFLSRFVIFKNKRYTIDDFMLYFFKRRNEF